MLKDKNFLCCILFVVAGIFFCVWYNPDSIHDFGNYYFGSKFALEGKDVHAIYEPYRFNLLIRELPDFQHEKFFENYAVVPPFTLLFYIPLTWLDAHSAKFLFNIISVLVFSLFLYKLLRHLNILSRLVFLLPILVFIPFRNNILFGQTYLLLTGFLLAGFLAEEKKKNIPSAIYYSLAIALKISPAILLFYLLARKNFRVALLTVLLSSMFFLSAVYFTGWNFLVQYLFDYVPRMSVNEINNPYATTYQSITVLLKNLFIPDQLLNPLAPFNTTIIYSILSGLCMGILFFLFRRQLLKDKDSFRLFSFTLASGLLFTAYTSSYSLVFLLPLCIAAMGKNGFKRLSILVLIFLVCTVPVNIFQSLPLVMRFPRLFLLVILFFLLLDEYKITRKDLVAFSACLVIFIAASLGLSKRGEDQSNYFLQKEISLLSYDFEFSGKNLLVKVMENNGPVEKIISLEDSVYSVIDIPLKDNQVYFPDQLTFGNDHKLKAVLVNGNEIVYLSDKNRGIGFYTLRKISLPLPGE